MGGAGLDRLAVLNHGLDAVGAHRAGEALALGLLATDHGDRQPFTGEALVHPEHPLGLLDRFLLGLVGCVSLLPEELGRAEEKSGAHLPADHVRPLIE